MLCGSWPAFSILLFTITIGQHFFKYYLNLFFLSWINAENSFFFCISNFCFFYFFFLIWPSNLLIHSLAIFILLFSLSVLFLIQTIIIFIHNISLWPFITSYTCFIYIYPSLCLWNDYFKFLFYIPLFLLSLAQVYVGSSVCLFLIS